MRCDMYVGFMRIAMLRSHTHTYVIHRQTYMPGYAQM